jgi:RNA recognition motif-containing protein
MSTYEEIMGIGSEASAAKALSQRLVAFRQWLTEEAKAEVHPAVCIVNGEATDGTKNAPVLVFERPVPAATPPTGTSNGSNSAGDGSAAAKKVEGRVGAIDGDGSAALYDRTMGCQVRAVRELKKDEVLLVLPRTSMVTPDLVAASDAGKAVLSCCKAVDNCNSFWDSLANTTECESRFSAKVARTAGPQTLVKILQERKKAESAFKTRVDLRNSGQASSPPIFRLAEYGSVSTRAPFLAFLIHQRFSNAERAPVSSTNPSFMDTADNLEDSAFRSVKVPVHYPPNAPKSFSPYARTLPSLVSVLLCWKRNELALLAGCIPGLSLLQEVGSTTLHLVAEFIALLDAGILERFPNTFPPGLLTWERWVWAAAVFGSRNLPASCYMNAVDTNSSGPADKLEFQTPMEIWNELGVMIPLLDMLNHEAVDHQVTWLPRGAGNEIEDDNGRLLPPRAVIHKKVKKGSEIFCCYGALSNANLMLQYGFAQMSNSSDEVRLGWALADAVGNVDPPFDFEAPYSTTTDDVFESHDESAINSWWTDDRIKLLEKEAFSSADSKFIPDLKARKKMTAIAYNDGTYHPILLSAAVIATMPAKDIRFHLSEEASSQPVSISKRHQRILQRYLQFSFMRKLEKLLQNLDAGLKGHFTSVKLWTKATGGGLNFQRDGDVCTGWQSFFDANAYRTTMEVENRYYAMGIDSCVLALYDGQLRALQVSLDGVSDDEKFAGGVLKQLVDLGFVLSDDDGEMEMDDDLESKPEASPKADVEDREEANGDSPEISSQNGASSKTSRNRKRNRKKNTGATGDRPPAVKLHIGSLSYTTTPSDLYEYFSSIYGQDNVLECHIPIERETGRSRGFGFVAMPEEIAHRALTSGRKHEVDGRVLKIARSNSAGTVSSVKVVEGPKPVATDRCATCGYRPKYCICPRPNVPGHVGPPGPFHGPPHPHPYDPPPDHDRGPRDGYRGGPPDYYRDDRYRDGDRYRQSDRGRHYHRDDNYHRSYDDDYNRERSRRERGRERSRDRSRDRSRSPDSRSSSRRWEHDERNRVSSRRNLRDSDDESEDYDRSRKRSRSRSHSRSKDKSSRRKKSKRRHRSRSRTENSP